MNKILILITTLALQSCATTSPESYADKDEFEEALIKTEELESQNIDYFECKDGSALYWDKIIVQLAAVPEENEGGVLVAGVQYYAIYAVRGIERVWIFGDIFENGDTPQYYISLKPNGIAHYFDLNDVKPDDDQITSRAVFECRPSN